MGLALLDLELLDSSTCVGVLNCGLDAVESLVDQDAAAVDREASSDEEGGDDDVGSDFLAPGEGFDCFNFCGCSVHGGLSVEVVGGLI